MTTPTTDLDPVVAFARRCAALAYRAVADEIGRCEIEEGNAYEARLDAFDALLAAARVSLAHRPARAATDAARSAIRAGADPLEVWRDAPESVVQWGDRG